MTNLYLLLYLLLKPNLYLAKLLKSWSLVLVPEIEPSLAFSALFWWQTFTYYFIYFWSKFVFVAKLLKSDRYWYLMNLFGFLCSWIIFWTNLYLLLYLLLKKFVFVAKLLKSWSPVLIPEIALSSLSLPSNNLLLYLYLLLYRLLSQSHLCSCRNRLICIWGVIYVL
jgi:hypothetical protein